MSNETAKIFIPIFEDELRIPNNEICSGCDAKIKHPLMPWIVGSDYLNTKERILFVGKPHRGTPGVILPSGVIDPTKEMENLKLETWPYWSYTRDILSVVYKGCNDSWDKISMSNIIKCTNTDANGSRSKDMTSLAMGEKCIKDLGIIFKEISILKPRIIIFYTYSLFRNMLNEFKVEGGAKVKEITDRNYRKNCGKKKLPWWERSVSTEWCDDIHVLVTGHPERMNKIEYVRVLSEWIVSKTKN